MFVQKFKIVCFTILNCFLLSNPAYASVVIDPNKPRPSLGAPVSTSEFVNFFSEYKGIAVAITGICVLTALIALIVNITRLSTSATNDFARRQALIGILYSCLALAIFGSATIVIGVFWNMFSPPGSGWVY